MIFFELIFKVYFSILPVKMDTRNNNYLVK